MTSKRKLSLLLQQCQQQGLVTIAHFTEDDGIFILAKHLKKHIAHYIFWKDGEEQHCDCMRLEDCPKDAQHVFQRALIKENLSIKNLFYHRKNYDVLLG